jgi:formylglycine-generating enzyme required for sulfatase activity
MKAAWSPLVVVAAVLAAMVSPALGQAPPNYGHDFVTIGDVGNPACMVPDPGGISYAQGRGSVGYEYRIDRSELTTAQWLGFVNHYSTLGGEWTFFGKPDHWGAQVDLSYTGPGLRYTLRNVPNAQQLPVAGLTWREAAMYCNWLHNGQATTIAAVSSGAYDTSTFTQNPGGTFNDQRTHSPGAKFWIPSLDEWIKAVHYDPDRNGPGEGGWWMYPNMSDSPLTYGPPGQGQANAAFHIPGSKEWDIPLGSYPLVRSPWGLLDAAGEAAEWTEETFPTWQPEERGMEGSFASGDPGLSELNDRITRLGSGDPWVGYTNGLRIVSSVPAPSSIPLAFAGACWWSRRTRRSA